jgi:serine protease Do
MLAQPQAGADGFGETLIQRVYDEVSGAVGLVSYTAEVTNAATGDISKRDGSALGIVVAPDGLVMTHGHMLLENMQPISIRFTVGVGENEKEYAATLLKKPEDVNLCFLRLESDVPLHLPCIRFAASRQLKLGEPLLTFGVFSQTLDYVPGLCIRRVGAVLERPRLTYCLDEPVRFGFVTGPVANSRGEVVGVIGFDLSSNEGGDLYIRSGHPLVYQADLFQKYIDNPPSASEILQQKEEAWIGVFTQPLSDDFAEYWGLAKEGGVIISTVVPGSPADKAGCRSGDVILTFDGVPVRPKLDREMAQFAKLVREAGVGKTISVKLLRKGQPVDLEIPLEARPTPSREAAEYEDEVFGLTIRELTTDVRIVLNLPDSVQGVIVRRVKSGGIAHLAGMRAGIIIMNFGDEPVTNLEEYRGAVQRAVQQKPSELTVFCRAGSATGFFRLEPRWSATEQK